MPDTKNEERSIRQVVTVNRVTKTSGGKMRPKTQVYHSCLLTCGHTIDKIKNKRSPNIPVRMKCLICSKLKQEALDENT